MLRSNRGFTLAEMMIVVLLLGLMLGFAVPALRRFSNSQGIKGARDNIVAQLQLARSRAISTGVRQPMHFFPGTYGWDYHLHPFGAPSASAGWRFPNGVSYATNTSVSITMWPDGSATADAPYYSNVVTLKNVQGVRDTITVLSSGLVVSQ